MSEESKAYQRGYVAGRKRIESELEELNLLHTEIHEKRVARHDAFFCAALTGLIQNGNWSIGDDRLKGIDDYIQVATIFADKAMLRMKP